MSPFQLCPKCACYVKREDPHCPFCGAPNEPRAAPSSPRHERGRASCGPWLALGSALSLSAAGCSATPPEASPVSRSVGEDGGPIVACSSRSGYFPCGTDEYCDRSVQACVNERCQAYQGALVTEEVVGPSPCGACPTCACLQPPFDCTCSEDGAGTISVVCSFGACYGAPPPRHERLS